MINWLNYSQAWFAPTRYWNIFSGGLVAEYQEEWEHALVEFNDLAEELLSNINQELSSQPNGAQLRWQLEDRAEQALQKAQTLAVNTWIKLYWLPVTRWALPSDRKRFPTIIEGEFDVIASQNTD